MQIPIIVNEVGRQTHITLILRWSPCISSETNSL